jgi:hypothetical protein
MVQDEKRVHFLWGEALRQFGPRLMPKIKKWLEAQDEGGQEATLSCLMPESDCTGLKPGGLRRHIPYMISVFSRLHRYEFEDAAIDRIAVAANEAIVRAIRRETDRAIRRGTASASRLILPQEGPAGPPRKEAFGLCAYLDGVTFNGKYYSQDQVEQAKEWVRSKGLPSGSTWESTALVMLEHFKAFQPTEGEGPEPA